MIDWAVLKETERDQGIDMFTSNILWIVFPTFVFYFWKFLQGALRILAQVLERFDLGTRVFILMLLKLQATGRNCGGAKAFNSV